MAAAAQRHRSCRGEAAGRVRPSRQMLIPHSPVVLVVLVVTTLYQAIATVLDNRRPPPGRLVDIDGGS